MIRWPSAQTLRTLSAVVAGFASACLAFSTVVLTIVVRDQNRELDCRAHEAVQVDVLRSEISLSLSRGLVAVVREDDVMLQVVVARLEVLHDRLQVASERRLSTVERCQ